MRRGGGPEVALRPYLMTVVRNVCYDRAASRARETLPGEAEVVAALDDLPTSYQNAELDQFTEANLVSRAFASLSDRWKHVLWQTDIEGRTPRELADELELAPTAVAALAFRAREGLADAYLAAHVTYRPTAQCDREPSELARYVRNRMRSKEQVTLRAPISTSATAAWRRSRSCVSSAGPCAACSGPPSSAPRSSATAEGDRDHRRVVTAQILTTAERGGRDRGDRRRGDRQGAVRAFEALRPTSSIEPQAAGTGDQLPGPARAARRTRVGRRGGAGRRRRRRRTGRRAAAGTVGPLPGADVDRPRRHDHGRRATASISLAGPTPTAPAEPTTPAALPGTTTAGATASTPARSRRRPRPCRPRRRRRPAPPPVARSAVPRPRPLTTAARRSAPTTAAPGAGGIAVAPIGGNSQTQSDGTDTMSHVARCRRTHDPSHPPTLAPPELRAGATDVGRASATGAGRR